MIFRLLDLSAREKEIIDADLWLLSFAEWLSIEKPLQLIFFNFKHENLF
jgi:hypothetical protein